MFGYIRTNEPDLRIREFVRYRSYYCGLCNALRDRSGIKGQLTLSYDLTFLVILLTALYEPETTLRESRCLLHPVNRHPERRNEATDYVADMNLMLSYYKCLDDWEDERKLLPGAESLLLKGKITEIGRRYPEKADRIKACLDGIRKCEQEKSRDPDLAAGLFGEIMGSVCVWREDVWADTLKELGFYLGKFIYYMDAWDDREKDAGSGNYNLFLLREDLQGEEILKMTMARCAAAYEMLPIVDVEEGEILRNIIYSGVWTTYGNGSLRGSGCKARSR